MLKFNIDRSLLSLLIVSCVVKGVLFEGVFFITIAILLCRNRVGINKNKYHRYFFVIIMLYLFLLFLMLFIFQTSNSWRPVGITKVLCGISICVLISDRLCENEIEKTFIKFLIIFNCIYLRFGDPEIGDNTLFGLIEYPSQNTLGCLNTIILPHILLTYKGSMPIFRFLYLITFILFFVKNVGTTLIASVVIVLFWILSYTLVDFLQNHTKLKRKIKLIRGLHRIIPLFIASMILLFFVNSYLQNFYLAFLFYADIDRYTILSQSLYRVNTASSSEFFWGRGDNNYHMLQSQRYVAAHNFIAEILTFSGIAGFSVLIFETYIFLKYMIDKMLKSNSIRAVSLSMALGYMFFLLHPVYTTSFLVKIFFVLINLRACHASERVCTK